MFTARTGPVSRRRRPAGGLSRTRTGIFSQLKVAHISAARFFFFKTPFFQLRFVTYEELVVSVAVVIFFFFFFLEIEERLNVPSEISNSEAHRLPGRCSLSELTLGSDLETQAPQESTETLEDTSESYQLCPDLVSQSTRTDSQATV